MGQEAWPQPPAPRRTKNPAGRSNSPPSGGRGRLCSGCSAQLGGARHRCWWGQEGRVSTTDLAGSIEGAQEAGRIPVEDDMNVGIKRSQERGSAARCRPTVIDVFAGYLLAHQHVGTWQRLTRAMFAVSHVLILWWCATQPLVNLSNLCMEPALNAD